MADNDEPLRNRLEGMVHLGSVTIGGDGPGTYLSGVFKLRGNLEEDLFSSAVSFLKAADRCLNGNQLQGSVETLVVPGAVCAALSCELFLKYIVFKETGQPPKGHQLAALFRKCSPESQSALSEHVPGIQAVLERNNAHFVDGRYHHEREQFSFRQSELLQAAESLSGFVSKRFGEGVA